MTSLKARPVENGTLDSFDDSEFSLIPEQPLEMENEAPNSHFDIGNSFPTQDVSVMERLVELVEDNKSMKEALKWNNVMMKEQLSTISEWHSQMTTSLSQQRVSLEEAQMKIQELEKENAELRKEKESSPLSDKEADFEFLHSKEFKEVENISDELKDREDKIEQRQKEADEKLMKLQKEADEKITKLQKEADDKISELQKDAETVAKLKEEAYDKIEELQKEVGRQNREVCRLKALSEEKNIENARLKERLQDHGEIKSRCESLLLQVESYQDNESMRLASHEVKKLKSALIDAEHRFLQEQQNLESERLMHKETKKLLHVLQADYDRVDKLLQIQSKDEKEKSEHLVSERQLETRRYLEQIDGLTAKLFDMEQQLEEKEEKLQLISAELEALKRDTEEIPILKSQVDVHKAEKEAEIERLTQQLNELQKAVSFCASCGAGNSHADAAARAKGRRKGSSSRQETPLCCPVCQFGFKDLQALQNHVNGCLDKAQ